MKFRFIAIFLLSALGCTVNLEVEELPPVKVEHQIPQLENLQDSMLESCTILQNSNLSLFLEGGVCPETNLNNYDCCHIQYQETCELSLCAPKYSSDSHCTVVGPGCQF